MNDTNATTGRNDDPTPDQIRALAASLRDDRPSGKVVGGRHSAPPAPDRRAGKIGSMRRRGGSTPS